jgi:hypothetical protein
MMSHNNLLERKQIEAGRERPILARILDARKRDTDKRRPTSTWLFIPYPLKIAIATRLCTSIVDCEASRMTMVRMGLQLIL